jgi:hypothetical protein
MWSNRNVYIEGTTSNYSLYFSGNNPVSEDAIVVGSGLYLINGETLADIANAIRIATGTSGPILTTNMASLIRNNIMHLATNEVSTTGIIDTYSLRQSENG